VDVFAIGWAGDCVDDINFLELWTCKSGKNAPSASQIRLHLESSTDTGLK
jgi:hypothetical protein